jgi:hypothetical protein
MVVHAYNPSTWEDEAGGLRGQGQPGLHSENLSQKSDCQNNFGKEDTVQYKYIQKTRVRL